MVLERSVRLENLNHWWIFSYFCFTYGVHCETWVEQESSSSLQTILNVTPTDARWFTWQCCRQLCHQPILDWNSASAGNEIWVDFKLCLSKVVGKVEFVIQIPDLCFSFEILLLIFDPRKDVSGLNLKVSDLRDSHLMCWNDWSLDAMSTLIELTRSHCRHAEPQRGESRLDADPSFVVSVECGQGKVNSKLQFKSRSTCLLQLAKSTDSILILCRNRDFSLLCRFWFCWQAWLGLKFNTPDKVKFDHGSATVMVSRLVLRFSVWIHVIFCSDLSYRDLCQDQCWTWREKQTKRIARFVNGFTTRNWIRSTNSKGQDSTHFTTDFVWIQTDSFCNLTRVCSVIQFILYRQYKHFRSNYI